MIGEGQYNRSLPYVHQQYLYKLVNREEDKNEEKRRRREKRNERKIIVEQL